MTKISKKFMSIFWCILYCMPLVILLITYIGYLSIYKESSNLYTDEEITYENVLNCESVPNSGLIDTIYFNVSLTVEETKEYLSLLPYSNSLYCILSTFDSNSTASQEYCLMVVNLGGDYVIFEYSHGYLFFASAIIEDLGNDFIGWNSNYVSLEINYNANDYNELNELNVGLYNDLIKNVVSNIPFEIVLSEVKTPISLYDLALKHTINTFDSFIWLPIKNAFENSLNLIGFGTSGLLGNLIILLLTWFIQFFVIHIFVIVLLLFPNMIKNVLERGGKIE